MNETRVTEAIESFKKALPDFESFEHPGETLDGEELAYKRELSEAFQELGRELLSGKGDQFLDGLQELFSRKLNSTNSRQNLVSWRDIHALFKVVNQGQETRQSIAGLLVALLQAADSDELVWKALDDLASWLSELGLKPSQTKIWPTFFLFLWRPDRYIFVKPQFFDAILEQLGIDKLGFGTRLNGDLYRRVMGDMERLLDQLDGLKVRDYIDLQSFLWKVNSVRPPDQLEINTWVIRASREQLSGGKTFSLTINWSEEQQLSDFYRKCANEKFQHSDVLLFLEEGSSNRILGEGRLESHEIADQSLELDVSAFVERNIEVEARTNNQLVLPGIVKDFGGRAVGAESLCCEYFDKVRQAYLLAWNPGIQAENSATNEAGLLRYAVGERTDWSCVSKRAKPGDPVYIARVGSLQPRGVVAKARVCSESYQRQHWDPTKAEKTQDCVLIQFESIRDGLGDAFLPSEILKDTFPEQVWSPQQSGIEIKPEYCERLHDQWHESAHDEFLLNLFSGWQETDHYADWSTRYENIIAAVERSKRTGSTDKELVERIWLTSSNGIANAGQGVMAKKVFAENEETLQSLTHELIHTPTSQNYSEILERFENLKEAGKISSIPRLLVKRAFAAANPKANCTIVNEKDLDEFGKNLSRAYGKVFDSRDNWIEKNIRLREFLLRRGIPDENLTAFNTFCWYLAKQLKPNGPPSLSSAVNVIFYGPPALARPTNLLKITSINIRVSRNC